MVENPYTLLKSTNRLPTPPGVAIRILELVESDETSIEDITQVISGDPALTSKIIKFINSPLIGLGFRGTTVAEAVARIGMRGAQMMALSFSLVSEKHRDTCPSFKFDRFWSESLARAVGARCIARHLQGWDPEEAFITGLLARIGKLVLATGLPAEYEPVLAGAAGAEQPLEQRERAALGTDHLEVGAQLLREWNLPEVVWKTIGTLAPGQEHANRSSRIIATADAIAAFMVEDVRHTAAAVQALAAAAFDSLEIDGEAFRVLLGQIGQDWINYGRLLSVQTSKAPDIQAIENQAEEHRNALRLASELEVQSLRAENQQLGRIARRDRLTGMFNRAAFDEDFATALKAAEESGAALALLLIDIDHFKAINDTHGHLTGDAALEHIARVLDDHARKRDTIYRYGGEEFAVIAPECPPAAVATLAEEFRRAVAGEPFVDGETRIAMSVSIGIGWVHWPERRSTAAELLEYADQRLYEAKHAGRNCWRLEPAAQRGGLLRKLGRFFGGSGNG
ncbi:MAG: GGDEF domain-containing protein [Opitutaceae bacterium]|nr:GGDEF domain-containing protein [Opitutaceae bacterium]